MLKPNPEYIDYIRKLVRESPFPQLMTMRLDAMHLDTATVVIDLNSSHLQPFGLVHGGVMATLIDTATFWAAYMRIPEDAGLVNVDIKLNYLKSITSGVLRAEGVAIKSGRSLSYAEARVYDEQETLLVHGTSTLMALPGKGLKAPMPKFLLPD